MIRSEVVFGSYRYPFYRGTDCVDEVVDRLVELGADRYIVVSDATVARLHATPVMERLQSRAAASLHLAPMGEADKGLAAVGRLLEEILAAGASRRACVVAFGGGVVGNLAGLVAALAFRGIRLVHLPTSLVALIDSVLSLKQAVNARVGKNLIGTFHCPVAVIADTAWLGTLPAREVRSGLAEMVKTGLAIVPSMLPALREVLRPDCRLAHDELLRLIDLAVEAKTRVMANDAYERGEGLALEYGHTVGHALELSAGGGLSHGEAVGLGMLCAARLGAGVCGLPERDVEAHDEMLGRIGVTPALLAAAAPVSAVDRLAFDNKRGYLPAAPASIAMVLLARLGQPRRRAGSLLTPVPFQTVAATVEWLATAAGATRG